MHYIRRCSSIKILTMALQTVSVALREFVIVEILCYCIFVHITFDQGGAQ